MLLNIELYTILGRYSGYWVLGIPTIGYWVFRLLGIGYSGYWVGIPTIEYWVFRLLGIPAGYPEFNSTNLSVQDAGSASAK